MPVERRDSVHVVSIVPGEELASVSNRTGVSVATLQSMNPGLDLKSTTKLVVPNSSVKLTNWRRAATPETTAASSLTTYRARKGETLARIAAARKLSAVDLARLNGIGPDVELKAGQEVKLPGTATTTNSKGR